MPGKYPATNETWSERMSRLVMGTKDKVVGKGGQDRSKKIDQLVDKMATGVGKHENQNSDKNN